MTDLIEQRKTAYLQHGLKEVPGWNGPGAFVFADTIDQVQRDVFWVAGNVGEIGVHLGQYFIYLGLLRRGGERAFACDVFEAQEANIDHSGKGNSDAADDRK